MEPDGQDLLDAAIAGKHALLRAAHWFVEGHNIVNWSGLQVANKLRELADAKDLTDHWEAEKTALHEKAAQAEAALAAVEKARATEAAAVGDEVVRLRAENEQLKAADSSPEVLRKAANRISALELLRESDRREFAAQIFKLEQEKSDLLRQRSEESTYVRITQR